MVRLRGWGLGSGGESGYWLYKHPAEPAGEEAQIPVQIRSCPRFVPARIAVTRGGSSRSRVHVRAVTKLAQKLHPYKALGGA